jgi:hypothetical protein
MSREYIMLPSAMMPSEIRQTHGALPNNHIRPNLATTSSRNQQDAFGQLLRAHPARRGSPGLFRDLDSALQDATIAGAELGLL